MNWISATWGCDLLPREATGGQQSQPTATCPCVQPPPKVQEVPGTPVSSGVVCPTRLRLRLGSPAVHSNPWKASSSCHKCQRLRSRKINGHALRGQMTLSKISSSSFSSCRIWFTCLLLGRSWKKTTPGSHWMTQMMHFLKKKKQQVIYFHDFWGKQTSGVCARRWEETFRCFGIMRRTACLSKLFQPLLLKKKKKKENTKMWVPLHKMPSIYSGGAT